MGTGNQQRPSPAAIALVAAIALYTMSLPALGQGKNLGFGDRFKAPAVTMPLAAYNTQFQFLDALRIMDVSPE